MGCCCCRGSVALHNVTINSTDLDFVSCPSSNTTLRIGQNLTCYGTYVIKEWDLQQPSLFFNVYGDSPTLHPDRRPSMGPTAMLHMLATSQLHLDVLAHTCHRTPASKLPALKSAACWSMLADCSFRAVPLPVLNCICPNGVGGSHAHSLLTRQPTAVVVCR